MLAISSYLLERALRTGRTQTIGLVVSTLASVGNSRMLPRWFGKIHPKYGTPVNALLFVGALSFIAPFFGEEMLGWLVDSGSPSIVIAYLLVSIVFVILRKREPEMERRARGGQVERDVVVGEQDRRHAGGPVGVGGAAG